MIVELNKVFRNITYTDRTHQYFLDGTPVMSVTQFLKSLQKPFDYEYWTLYKAVEASGFTVKPVFGKQGLSTEVMSVDGNIYLISDVEQLELTVTKKDIRREWNIKSSIGTTRGSFGHYYLERLEQGLLDKPEIRIPKGLSFEQAIDFTTSVKNLELLCEQYVKDNRHLIPVAIEYKIGDRDLMLTGTFDRLYFNEETNMYEIHDFKTDKKIETKSKFGNKFKIFDIPDCEFSKYSLQTSLYKHIIEKNLNCELGISRITHFNLEENKINYFDCTDYTSLIKEKSQHDDWASHIKLSGVSTGIQ